MKNVEASKKAHIGKRLRYLRGKRSQVEYAKKLQVTQSYLSQVELGKKIPSLEMLMYLAYSQHTTVGFLLGETDDPEPLNDLCTLADILGAASPDVLALLDSIDGDTTVSTLTLLSLVKDRLAREADKLNDSEKELFRMIFENCRSYLDGN